MAGAIQLGIEIMQMDDSPLSKLIKDLEKGEELGKSFSELDIKKLIKQFNSLDEEIKNINKQTKLQKDIMKNVGAETKKNAKESAKTFKLGAKQLEESKRIQVQLIDVEKQLYFAKKKNLVDTTGLLNKYQKKLKSGFELNQIELKMLEKTKAIENDTFKQKEAFVRKISAKKEKANKKEYDNQSKLMALEIKLAKNGLTKQYQAQLDHFMKTKNLRKEDIRNFEHMINMQISTTQESRRRMGSGNDLFMSGAQLLTFTKALQVLKNITNQMRELDRAVFNMGVVAGESVGRIREMRGELLEMASTLPIAALELAKSIDTIERTGYKTLARHKKSLFMLEYPKVA